MMAQLPQDSLDRGVICSSAGNHAQGVALAAAQLGCSAIICMPVTTPAIKVGLKALRVMRFEGVAKGVRVQGLGSSNKTSF